MSRLVSQLIALVTLAVATSLFAQPTTAPVTATPASATPASAMQPSARTDSFIAGYAAAVLEREFSISANGLSVENGVVYLRGRGFGDLEEQQLRKSLSAVPGVTHVIIDDATDTPPTPGMEGVALPGPAAVTPEQIGNEVAALRPNADPAARAKLPGRDRGPTFYLSSGRLFEPLLADPRWPHFYASYNRYLKSGEVKGGEDLHDVGSVGFGETIAIARQQFKNDIRIEAGIQASVFAVFNLGAESKDLVNADYFVGPYVTTRLNNFSLLTRLYHQSSHLGDEYLLGNSVDRINLSYEAVDLIASYEFPNGFRLYGGAAYLFDQDPSDYKPWQFQYGAEFRSPWTFGGGNGIRPVAALDVKQKEEADYNADFSLRVGLQFEDPRRLSQKMLILLEYYNGQSPNGQFFDENIEFVGIGLHFYF